jgi:hypothetical protein
LTGVDDMQGTKDADNSNGRSLTAKKKAIENKMTNMKRIQANTLTPNKDP